MPVPAEGCAEAGGAHAALLGLRPCFLVCLIHSAPQQRIPWAGDYYIAVFFLFSFVAVIEGADFITSIQWKEMIKNQRGKAGKHHLRNKCEVTTPLSA